MNREEAIEKLESLRQKVDEETYRALIMGIKALEQNESAEEWYKLFVEKLSQEPCTDAVSRDAVIEWLKDKDIIKLSSQEETAIKELKALPSVTHKSGKWEDLHRCWVCSECGKQTHIEHKYCPN